MDLYILCIYLVLIICWIIVEYKLYKLNYETFIVNESNFIKKTNKYNLVYKNNDYTIWEPESIEDYFPTCQYISKNSKQPKCSAILIKSNSNYKDRAVDYKLISSTEDGMGIWEPVPNKGYVSLGHVFNKNKPSKHKFRCININNTEPSFLNKKAIQKDFELENGNSGYSIWYVGKDHNFIGASLNNDKIPNNKIFKLRENKCLVNKTLLLKNTSSYEKIWSSYNTQTQKLINIWKPIPVSDYKNLGYIALSNDINPNGKLLTLTAHKDFVKEPNRYEEESVASFESKKDTISFWKPVPPKGYCCLSHAISMSKEEPINTEIYCIPIEYTKDIQNYNKLVWNSIPNTKKKISIYVDTNNFLIANNDYSESTELQYQINHKFIDMEKDILDNSKTVLFDYNLNNNNTDLYTSDERDNLIISTLSERLDINKHRLKNLKFLNNRRKIEIIILPRPSGSDQLTVHEIIRNLEQMISLKGIKVKNNNENYILTLNNIEVPYKNDKISIDNNLFIQKIN